MKRTWEGKTQPLDSSSHRTVFPEREFRDIHEGLNLLLERIQDCRDAAEELRLRENPYQDDLNILQTMIDFGEEELAKPHGHTMRPDNISVSSFRYIKAALLTLAAEKRDKKSELLSKGRRVPPPVIDAMNEEIQRLQNIAETGLMNALKPADVFFDVVECQFDRDEVPTASNGKGLTPPGKDSGSPAAPPAPIVMDDELRQRCLPLYVRFAGDALDEHLDTVVREISVVLSRFASGNAGFGGRARRGARLRLSHNCFSVGNRGRFLCFCAEFS